MRNLHTNDSVSPIREGRPQRRWQNLAFATHNQLKKPTAPQPLPSIS